MARWEDPQRDERWIGVIIAGISAGFVALVFVLLMFTLAEQADAAPPSGRCDACKIQAAPTPRPTPVVIGLPLPTTPAPGPKLTPPPTDTE